MKPALALRLSQHLALTPQLQQSIRLLQLSTVELNQEIEQALADNPLLERDDDSLAGSETPAAAPDIEGNESNEASASGESADAMSDSGGDTTLDWGARTE